MNGHWLSASFRELFYPGSEHTRDLTGWIEAELAMAEEGAASGGRPRPTGIDVLPFGGFERRERMYVVVAPERLGLPPESLGQVWLWARGSPPTRKMGLAQDTMALVAGDVPALFDLLSLNGDPFGEQSDGDEDGEASGLAMRHVVHQVAADDVMVAAKLQAWIQVSVFDWRGVLAAGPYRGTFEQERASRLAFSQVVADDDVELFDALVQRGYPTDAVVHGRSTPLAMAAWHGASDVMRRLVSSSRPLGDAPVIHCYGVDDDLMERMIARGVEFDVDALVSLGEEGRLDAALRLFADGRRYGRWDHPHSRLVEAADRVGGPAAHNLRLLAGRLP